MAAAVKPRDACRVFQDAPALLWLGVDKLADLALLNQRLTARAGSGVGKEDLDVLRARVLAVHLVDRARLTLNAARNLKHIGIVEGGRRGALRIVERNHHFGHVARRPLVRTGEDHVVHGGPAHVLIGGFPHHPAKGFEEVGFPAAVGADNACQARPDDELGRLHERFKTEKP